MPASLILADGGLAYVASEGEVNRLAVDVVRSDGVNYIRFRELGDVQITVQGTGLISVSAQEARARTAGITAVEILTRDRDDTMSLVLDQRLPGPIAIDLGPADATNAMTVLGTDADDAVALAPLLTEDGERVIELTSGGLEMTFNLRGSLTVDLSQAGQDSLTVDRGVSSHGRLTGLGMVGGGGGDTLNVTASGSNPQDFTLTDGHVLVENVWSSSGMTLGRSDNIAIDQPRATVEVIAYDDAGNEASLGPSYFNTFLLDTGATGILFAAEATAQLVLNDSGYPYETVGQYDEQGVAGSNLWDVSAPYRFDFAGYSGVRNTLTDVEFLSSETHSFSFLGPWGIVGMPAMVGRVTNVDMTGWSTLQDPLDLSMRVEFSDEAPEPTPHTFTVPLSLRDFPADGQIDGGPIPTMAPLPFVQVETEDGANHTSGQFLVDTGAQLSMISSATAFALGLDRNGDGSIEDDAVDFIEVGGVGGTIVIPLLPFEKATIATDQGPRLTWSSMLVGVLDIEVEGGPQIDGIFGMDYLTSGWAAKVLPQLLGQPGADEDGFFQHVSFDFRDSDNDAGSLILDVTPSRDSLRSDLDLSYSNVSRLNVTGGSDDDTFVVTPTAATVYTLDGAGHVAGNALQLLGEGLAVHDDGNTLTIEGYQVINYANIQIKQGIPGGGATAIIDDGGSGFGTAGSWSPSSLGGFRGDSLYSVQGTGADTATWAFDVEPGRTYRVTATWPPNGNRASNAPFTILDGATPLGTVAVNQRLAPDDESAEGASWELLGEYAVGGGRLVVRLSDAANGVVGADAIRIQAVDAPPPPSQVVDDGGSGFGTAGSWSPSSLGGFRGDSLYSMQGTGADTASWAFDVEPGRTYRVTATWPPNGNRASNAPFTILDGATPLGTVAVNQRLAPDDESAEGASWELLGEYAVVGGRLVVRLSDAANGVVGADAIRIREVAAGTAHLSSAPSVQGVTSTRFPTASASDLVLLTDQSGSQLRGETAVLDSILESGLGVSSSGRGLRFQSGLGPMLSGIGLTSRAQTLLSPEVAVALADLAPVSPWKVGRNRRR